MTDLAGIGSRLIFDAVMGYVVEKALGSNV